MDIFFGQQQQEGLKRSALQSMIFSKEIVQARKKFNLSQAKLAKLLGISVRTLESWERGVRNPSGSAQALLKLFIRSPEFVLTNLA